jgi:hypothetical protein
MPDGLPERRQRWAVDADVVRAKTLDAVVVGESAVTAHITILVMIRTPLTSPRPRLT